MPEKVTWEEKIVELAILKAKEVLQEANLNTLELDEPLTGEEVKIKKPKKNPSEESLPKTSNVEGKEDKLNEVTKASIIAGLESLIKQYEEQYGEKYSPLGNDASPFQQNESNLMDEATYKDAMAELETAVAEMKNDKKGAAQKAHNAIRVLMELDMGTTASAASSINPPRPQFA
tara:strand:+ start:257 stop:781 length:525 start_codon:yes stop_codon:yes gene_type:complete